MNIKRVKIYGAGSIGNHLAHASRTLGCEVVVCDVDPEALKRMQNEIYPSRYGQWDEGIQLSDVDNAPKGGFDLICIGTPPDYHLDIAMSAIEEKPQAIQIEKPLCTPSLENAQEVLDSAKAAGVEIFVGYDHVIGKMTAQAREMVESNKIGNIQTIDIDWREYWGGIFNAHPWLAGPHDSYLGFWKRGGGSAGEHSHAINLWQSFAHSIGAGRVVEVNAMVQYVSDDKVDYDSLCLLNLRTESGFVGRVVQDVITQPVLKATTIQGENGSIQCLNGYNPQGDAIKVTNKDGSEPEIIEVHKTRPDDFIEEIKYIDAQLDSDSDDNLLSLERGLETMLVVSAAHLSEKEKKSVMIDYSKGYTTEALSTL